MSKNYIRYIAYFLSVNVQFVPVKEIQAFIERECTSRFLEEAPTSRLRRCAGHMYRAYVAGVYSKRHPFDILKTLSSAEIEEYLDELERVNTRFGLYVEYVSKDFSEEALEDRETGVYATTGGDVNVEKVLVGLGLAREKEDVPKRVKSSGRKKVSTKRKKTSSRKASTKRSSSKRKSSSLSGKASDYTRDVLKEIARKRGIEGYRSMKKPELCKVLGLK